MGNIAIERCLRVISVEDSWSRNQDFNDADERKWHMMKRHDLAWMREIRKERHTCKMSRMNKRTLGIIPTPDAYIIVYK